MVRKVVLTVPHVVTDSNGIRTGSTEALKQIDTILTQAYGLYGKHSVFNGPKHDMVVFRASPKNLGPVLNELQLQVGVGVRFGRIDIVALASTIPAVHLHKDPNKAKHFRARTDHASPEEIVFLIDAESHLTFDYMGYLVLASIMAAVGLIQDSSVFVVASMLISPLMGPILAMSYGLYACNWRMFLRGLRNEVVGFVITLICGVVCGACAGPFYGPKGWLVTWNLNTTADNLLVSYQITSRGANWMVVFSNFPIAIPSGFALGLAVTGENKFGFLIGVAIAASLLPPVCTTGIAFMFASFNYDNSERDMWLLTAMWSFLLFVATVIPVVFFCAMTFWFKGIRPLHTKKSFWERLGALKDYRIGSMQRRHTRAVLENSDSYVMQSPLLPEGHLMQRDGAMSMPAAITSTEGSALLLPTRLSPSPSALPQRGAAPLPGTPPPPLPPVPAHLGSNGTPSSV